MSLVGLWTERSGAGHNGGGATRVLAGRLPSQADGLADPLAEGIHQDTDGPDQASDRVEYVAHLPGRSLAPADF